MRSNAFEAGVPFLYHFQPFRKDHVIDLLTNQRIHSSNLLNLNDPWDCRPHFDAASVADPEVFRRIADWFSLMSNPAIHPKEKLMDYMAKHSELTVRMMVKRLNQDLNDLIPKRWGIYCLTPRISSTLMWSHYTNNHRGICLQFAVERTNLFGRALRVQYFKRYPEWKLYDLDESDTANILLLSKAECWEYEEEYRIIGRIGEKRDDRALALPIIKNGFLDLDQRDLRSIIAGCEMGKEDFTALGALINELAPQITLKRMMRKPGHFSLQGEM